MGVNIYIYGVYVVEIFIYNYLKLFYSSTFSYIYINFVLNFF